MTAVSPHVPDRVVLSDSLHRSRPDFTMYMKVDANAGGNTVKQIEQQRLERSMKFPTLVGRKDVDSFKELQNAKADQFENSGFRKFNDEGDHRPDAPNRFCDNTTDPVSGFVSVCGDVDRHTGHTRIKPMVQLNMTPQSYNPRDLTSIRMYDSAPPETQRKTDRDPGMPYVWSGRKVLDSALRASLGGWTSDKDPRVVEEERLKGDEAKKPKDHTKEVRDNLALKFMYTSSTQRAYEELPWDTMTRPRRWAATTTLENKPDMISQTFTNKRYDPAAQEYQGIGRSWDWFQTRKSNYKKNIPIPGTVFSSACGRKQQIPGYSGMIGGENILEIENPDEKFEPFTVKRANVPRPTDTAYRPNIPLYEGCTLYTQDRLAHSMHSNAVPPEPQTSLRVHRSMPITPNLSDFRKRSYMSKMVTTVPPSNPFNRIDKEPVQLGQEPPKDMGSATQQQLILAS